MDYNYHTHTTRCHHARGTDEEYIESAIRAGIKHLGFSDHMPHIFPDGYESSYRVDMSEGESYVRDVQALKEKYRDEIELSVGFEMEYYPLYFDQMLENARKFGAEYLICGQHFLGNEHPGGIGTRGIITESSYLIEYVDCCIKAMESGVFTYIAHPDIILFKGNDRLYKKEMTRLCEMAKETNTPLEINLSGIRYNLHYPDERFWKIAGKIGAPVTFGRDAHDSTALLDSEPVAIAKILVKRYKLNYIGRPKLVPIV